MEWYVKFGALPFLCLIGIPYIVQKFSPPKSDNYAPPKKDYYRPGPLEIRVNTEPQHPDVTRIRKRLRKKR